MIHQNLTKLTEGQIHTLLKDKGIETLEWRPHASFPGVSMKHLIVAEDTDGCFSVHLVRVDSGSALLEHTHAGRWELHHILEGRGSARIGEKKMTYSSATLSVIPADTAHRVDAEEDLLILAHFIPALC